MQLKRILELEHLPQDAIKQETEQTIKDFCASVDNANSLASKLILLQEVCLKVGILPAINLLDQKNKVNLLDSLDQTKERMLLV